MGVVDPRDSAAAHRIRDTSEMSFSADKVGAFLNSSFFIKKKLGMYLRKGGREERDR
jgi:hypothetical protein